MDFGPVGAQRTIASRQRALMRWYKTHGRHHLPWRKTRDPYQILVSEVMLQQTQVDRVIPYWNKWVRCWPTMQALARAKRADVIRAWAGLGYNRRAVYLHKLAQRVTREPSFRRLLHDSPHPPTPPTPHKGRGEMKSIFSPFKLEGEREGVEIAAIVRVLQRLPGIGPYTANALLAFVWNLSAPCVDTNVRRVLAHVIYRRPAIMRMSLPQVMRLAARIIPRGRGRDWNYALMDYGALVLTARKIHKWPTPGVGHSRKAERFEGSSRFWRGRIVAVLRDTLRLLSVSDLRSRLAAFGVPPSNLHVLMGALIRDGIVTAVRHRYRLPTS